MDFNQQNQIEAYLSGQMTPEEVSKFESLLDVNPELQQQVAFQADIIKGIGGVRKAQLKARLESLNPTAAWWSVSQISPVGQYFSVGVLTAVIGIGVYWLVSSNTSVIEEQTKSIFIDAPSMELKSWDLPEIENIPSVEKIEALAVEEQAISKKPVEPVTEVDDFMPIVAVPNAGDVEAEQEFQPEELPAPDEAVRAKPSDNAIDVEVVESKTSKIKYRYYAGKLYLYGTFKEEPYQILEVNSSQGRRVFLYHNRVFYKIEQTDRPEPLIEIQDRDLIRELSILRKAK